MSSTRSGDGGPPVAPEPLAALFAAVGDPTRLTLLRFLMRDEHCVTQCSEHIGLTHSAASKQLNALAAAGILTVRPHGRRRYFRVGDPEDVSKILDAAESFMTQRSHLRSSEALARPLARK